LQHAKEEKKIAVADVDVSGVHNILKAKPDTLVVLLLPPTFEEWYRRIMSRGHMGHAELHRRFTTAKKIFEDALQKDFYKYVVADRVERSALQINDLAQGKPNTHQSEGRELIHNLKIQLEEKLRSL
jgi:guanylate kinase